MWVYYSIATLLSLLTILQILIPRIKITIFAVAPLVLIIGTVIGTRHEIGADWAAYQNYFDIAREMRLADALRLSDPAYIFVGWIASKVSSEIYFANTLYAIVGLFGIVKLSRITPHPLILICTAWPYLIMVVMMGYARQGVAIGIVMWAITFADYRKVKSYIALILLAALFHKSAVVMLPFASFILFDSKKVSVFFALLILPLLAISFIDSGIDKLSGHYLEVERTSRGALLRALIVFLLCGAFLLWVDREPRAFWRPYAWVGVLMPLLVIVSPSSTLVDRFSLYFYPAALVAASSVRGIFHPPKAEQFINALIVLIFAAQMHFWLMTTNYIDSWAPYKTMLSDYF